MRLDNIFRFLVAAFVVGAVLGLAGGLVFAGGGNDSAQAKTEPKAAAAASPTTTSVSAKTVGSMTPAKARTIGANELGQVPVLVYHKLGEPEARYTRSPDHFRRDIDDLKAAGFYPITTRDLVTGNIDVPAGKSPVVLTFDDSSPNQFRLRSDGSLDPDSAVGILKAAAKKGDWAEKATFYCLLDVQPNNNVLFGQPDSQTEKLVKLVSWGYEVGSHTVTHLNLSKASKQESQKQLLQSQEKLNKLIGNGYKVATLSVPFGAYPKDEGMLAKGTWDGRSYTYLGAVSLLDKASASPFSKAFTPLHIPRFEMSAKESSLKPMLTHFSQHPELRFVSDGDPAAISVPKAASAELGALIDRPGRAVITY